MQRNEGLKLVESEVVFFPDDDSLCDPDYAEHVMRIYERDTDRVVGGVTGTHRPRMRDSEDDQAPVCLRCRSGHGCAS